jgi:lipid A 3-O-deacylase
MKRVLVASLLTAGANAFAQTTETQKPADPPASHSFQWENDSWAFGRKSTDRWYTNGLRITKTYHPSEQERATYQPNGLHELTEGWCRGKCTTRGWSFGQLMFTPSHLDVPAPQPNDRPWAGWLYYGFTAQKLDPLAETLDGLEIDFGIVGPLALGKPIQAGWHRLLQDWGRNPPIPTWHDQLRNEPGFLIDTQRRFRLWRLASEKGRTLVDVVPHYGANAGNVLSTLYGGGALRIGYNVTGFGVPNMRSLANNADTNPRRKAARPARTQFGGPPDGEWIKEAYFFLHTEGRLVARNITLDGNTFRDSPSVDKKRVVADVGWGFSLRFWGGWNEVRFNYARVKRSPEFEGPPGTQRSPQLFGSLSLTSEIPFD